MATDSGVVQTDQPLRFRILGPIEVDVGQRTADLGGPRQRAVLAHLLLRANRLVPADALVDSIWGDEQPETARGVVHTYISLLRRAIGKDRIEGRPPGYVLLVRPDELDAARFDQLLRDAKRTLPADPTHALVTIDDALRLWRGPALADVASQPGISADAARLDELRVDAEEARVLALLSTDQSRLAVAELERLLVDEPLREGLWGLLMVALYREGRQADALEAYGRARRILRDQLGVDPSPELDRIQARVLRQDPDLEVRGERFRGYQLLEKVRTRPELVVYRARQPRVGRDVAIALYRDEVASDPDFARRFEPEVRALAGLEYPAIAPILDFWREPGSSCVVSRYLTGGSLAGLLERGESLEPTRAAETVERIRAALTFAHRSGVAHGDVTPDNVMFDADGDAVLTGFRVAVGPRLEPDADLDALAAIARRLGVPWPGTAPGRVGASAGVERQAVLRHVRNPYKGLRAFEERDARDFFGRQRAVRRLLSRMREPAPGGRSLFVIGPSGAGKSSLVRAGLLPELRAGAVSNGRPTFVTDMFPGTRPMEALEVALERVASEGVDVWRHALRSGPRGLLEVSSSVLPAGADLVLVVDQLEEIFTLTDDETERELFLEALRVAVADPDSRVRLVATLRADMFDRPLAYPHFGELMARRSEVVMPLSADEFEQAVTGPAAAEGVSLEPGLVAALVADAVHQPGSLPLLQFCLSELFEERTADVIELRAYEEIGGIAGALSARAERLYLDSDSDAQRAMREVLLRLVTLGEGRSDTRRRVARSELDALDVPDEAIESVLETLGRHRLLTFDREDSSREPTVEVAHEALLSAWSRLRGWIDGARDDLRTEQGLARAAAEWRAAERDDSFLLTGPRLDQAEAWARTTDLALARDELAYIHASVERRAREQAEDQARRDATRGLERRARTRLQAFVAVLAIGLVLTTALGGIALWQSARADHDALISHAREIAAAALAGLNEDPERSVLLAIEAVRATREIDGSVLPEATTALHQAIAASHVRTFVPEVAGSLAWSPDGWFVASQSSVPGAIQVRDDSDGEVIRSFEAHDGPITDVALSSDGHMLATTGADGCLRTWDPASGSRLAEVCGTGLAQGVSVAAGRAAAAWPDDRVYRVIDAASGADVAELPVDSPVEVSLSPDGLLIATALDAPDDPRVDVYDVASGQRSFDAIRVIRGGHQWGISRVAWSPDAKWIATAGDASANVWSAGGQHVAEYGFPSDFVDVAWSADSRRLATAAAGGTVRVWDAAKPDAAALAELSVNAFRTGLRAVALSPDGERVLASGDLGGVAGWDIRPRSTDEVLSMPTISWYGDVGFTADGKSLVAVDADSRRVTWRNLQDGTVTRTLGPLVSEHWFDLSPDGSSVAIAANDRFTVWSTETGARILRMDMPDAGFDWSPDGSRIAVGGRIIDKFGRELQTLHVDGFWPREPKFSPDGRLLAISGNGPPIGDQELGPERVAVFDVETGRNVSLIEHPSFDALFDPAGERLLLDGTAPGGPTVWDARSGRLLFTITGAGSGFDAAFSPDGKLIAAAGFDGWVRLFDAVSAQQLGSLWAGPQIRTVEFSPDGRMLAAQRPNEVKVWAVDINLLLEIASERVTRSLTQDECHQFLHVDQCPIGVH